MVHLIQEKRSSLQTTMEEIQRKEHELSVLEEVINHQHMSIACIEQLQELLLKKHSFKKMKRQIYIVLFIYVVALTILIFVAQSIGEVNMHFIIFIASAFLLFFIYLHAKNTAYVCMQCHRKFSLSFMKDLYTLHDPKKGKKTTCPYCKHKGWFQETYFD